MKKRPVIPKLKRQHKNQANQTNKKQKVIKKINKKLKKLDYVCIKVLKNIWLCINYGKYKITKDQLD